MTEYTNSRPVMAFFEDTKEKIGTFPTIKKALIHLTGRTHNGTAGLVDGKRLDGTRKCLKATKFNNRKVYLRSASPSKVHG